jgi:preprotein translocase subunit SecD
VTTERVAGRVHPRNHGWRPLVAIVGVAAVLAAVAIALVSWHRADPVRAAGCDDKVRAQVELTAERAAPPARLSETADILRRRLSLYDCGTPAVRVAGERLRVDTSRDAALHLDELIAPGELQLREVLEARPAGQCQAVAPARRVDAVLMACSTDGSEQFRLAAAKVVGTDVDSAKASRDRTTGTWQITLHFTDRGQRAFTRLTKQLVGKRMAVVVDGRVVSAPHIQAQIDGGAQISGSFTQAGAEALAGLLEYGALPVPLRRV